MKLVANFVKARTHQGSFICEFLHQCYLPQVIINKSRDTSTSLDGACHISLLSDLLQHYVYTMRGTWGLKQVLSLFH